MSAFKTIIVPVMGFTQSTSSVTGLTRWWRSVRGLSSSENWILHPQHWKADMKALSSLIYRNSNDETRIMLAGYSWGFGNGVMSLLRHFERLGRVAERVVSIDGVYKSWWLPASISPIRRTIKLPPQTVQHFYRFYQRVDNPCGHDVIHTPGDVLAQIYDPVRINVPHSAMDDQPIVHAKLTELAEAVCGSQSSLHP